MNPVSVEATAVAAVERQLVPGQRWAGGGSETPPVALPCPACGVLTFRSLCHFDRRTVELIQARRCVSCTAPIYDEDSAKTESWCGDCLSRHNRSSRGTRWLLRQAAAARYQVSLSSRQSSTIAA